MAISLQARAVSHGYDPCLLDRATDRLIVKALFLAQGKVLTTGRDGQHLELALDGASSEIAGTRCYMNLEQYAPSLAVRLAPALAGLKRVDRVNLYASPPGGGTPLHFDTGDVCIVQLFGRKTWWVAQESAVQNPSANCVFPDGAATVSYDGLDLPRPGKLLERVLSPGDWLCIPRGVWHRTHTDVGSVSSSLAVLEGADRPNDGDLQ